MPGFMAYQTPKAIGGLTGRHKWAGQWAAFPRRKDTAAAAPAIAAPPAEPMTSQRVSRGNSCHEDRLAATSRASERAPAATHALACPASPSWRCKAASAPRPSARSRPPSARPNTCAARLSAAAPTQGRAGTDGQARAVRPSATRPAATAAAPRRNKTGIAVVNVQFLPGGATIRPRSWSRCSSSRYRAQGLPSGALTQPGRPAVTSLDGTMVPGAKRPRGPGLLGAKSSTWKSSRMTWAAARRDGADGAGGLRPGRAAG
jgi:hypothetical protein